MSRTSDIVHEMWVQPTDARDYIVHERYSPGPWLKTYPVYNGRICISASECRYIFGVESLHNLPEHVNGYLCIRYSQAKHTGTRCPEEEAEVRAHEVDNLAQYGYLRLAYEIGAL